MKISVVIPTRNEAACIEGTLIRLRETAPAASIEVIVVDAASTDGTADMARRHADIFRRHSGIVFGYRNFSSVARALGTAQTRSR